MSVRPAEKVKNLVMCSINKYSVSVIVDSVDFRIDKKKTLLVFGYSILPLTEHITITSNTYISNYLNFDFIF